MADQQADKKSDSPITGAKIAVVGAIIAALIGATATITAALLQRKDSVPDYSGFFPKDNMRVLDKSALEGSDGVKKILIGTYGIQADQITNLNCPSDQEVKAGNKFTCTFRFGGDNPVEKIVDITVLDDNGQYQVGQPRDR